jgi:hypothetical protein
MTGPNDKREQPTDAGGGFAAPRVFNSIEEALAASTPEEEYLDGLDQDTGDDE